MENLEILENMLETIGEELPEKKAFEVTDMLAADWALSKIGMCEGKMSQRTAFAIEQKERIDIWLAKENSKEAVLVDFLAEKLHPWLRQELQDEKKKRSISLPSGKIGFRKTGGGIDITDEEKALKWAKEYCEEAVKVKESVLKTPLKKHLESTGEIPDGCDSLPTVDKFYVDPA